LEIISDDPYAAGEAKTGDLAGIYHQLSIFISISGYDFRSDINTILPMFTDIASLHKEAFKLTRLAKREMLASFDYEIEERDGLLAEFDETLWHATFEAVTVLSEKNVAVQFKYSEEIHIGFRGK
jgi:hypothetical protein